MGASSEEYIELAEEWVNVNWHTGFVNYENYYQEVGSTSWTENIKRARKIRKQTIKKKDLKVWMDR
jgi:hypothetical protein